MYDCKTVPSGYSIWRTDVGGIYRGLEYMFYAYGRYKG